MLLSRRRFLPALLLLVAGLLAGCGNPGQGDRAGSTPPNFEADKDYQRVDRSDITPKPEPKPSVRVVEFFSYGCPACYHVEPALEKWLARQPSSVKFERVPLSFDPSWQKFARLYYTAKMLGVQEKLNLPLFKAIQKDDQNLTNPERTKAFFVAHGVKPDDYDATAGFAVGLDAQILRGDALMKEYKITAAPTLVVDGRFKVDPSMTGGDLERFFSVTDYLIEKIKKGEL